MHKVWLKKPCLGAAALAFALVTSAPQALADRSNRDGGHGSFSNFDSAQNVVGGLFPGISAVDLTSVPCGLTGPPTAANLDDCANSTPYNVTDSGVVWTPPKYQPPTLAQITTLSTAYNFGGTDCGGGSPRCVIVLNSGSFLSGYFGPPPSFTGCPAGWQNTGNFVNPADPTARWAVGNSGSYQPYATVSAPFQNQQVTQIFVVVDGGWLPSLVQPRGQDLTIDNFTVNNDVLHSNPYAGQ